MTGEGAADSVPSFADMLRLRPDSGAPDGVSRTTATLTSRGGRGRARMPVFSPPWR